MADIQFQRGTEAAFANNNPTLADGELGYETDTRRVKIGDGSTAWETLPYLIEQDVTKEGSPSFTGLMLECAGGCLQITDVDDADASEAGYIEANWKGQTVYLKFSTTK